MTLYGRVITTATLGGAVVGSLSGLTVVTPSIATPVAGIVGLAVGLAFGLLAGVVAALIWVTTRRLESFLFRIAAIGVSAALLAWPLVTLLLLTAELEMNPLVINLFSMLCGLGAVVAVLVATRPVPSTSESERSVA